jgi:branched-chain amino acid aminotransferase
MREMSKQPLQTELGQPTASSPTVYLNGRLVAQDEAVVSVFDSGLGFGDGVFEGLRVYNGRVFRLEAHIARLYQSAAVFDIDIGLPPDRFAAEILDWLSKNHVRGDFHFRPIVTRGTRFPPRSDPRLVTGGPTILFIGGTIQATSMDGIRVIISSIRRTAPDALDPHVKSLSFANNLLPRLEARRYGADDAVVLDAAGFVAEGSTANIFVVRHGELLTPFPRACLAGVTRAAVIELAREAGLSVAEGYISPAELIGADEVLLTGTGAEITPVVEVNGHTIGKGGAGPVTRELARQYATLVSSEGTAIP